MCAEVSSARWRVVRKRSSLGCPTKVFREMTMNSWPDPLRKIVTVNGTKIIFEFYLYSSVVPLLLKSVCANVYVRVPACGLHVCAHPRESALVLNCLLFLPPCFN